MKRTDFEHKHRYYDELGLYDEKRQREDVERAIKNSPAHSWLLDAGCGQNPWPNAFHIDMRREAHHLEVLCDIHRLPFIDKCFKNSRLHHVLEHLQNPSTALEELRRVTRSRILICTPDAQRASVEEDSSHLFSWNSATLQQLLSTKFAKVTSTKNFMQKNQTKLETVKYLILGIFSRSNELIAICEGEKQI
jgi:hypothetical protein